jgi:hypothetical protein
MPGLSVEDRSRIEECAERKRPVHWELGVRCLEAIDELEGRVQRLQHERVRATASPDGDQ